METTKFLSISVICIKIDGISFFVQRLGAFYLALSPYAPDLRNGRAEVYHVDLLSYLNEYTTLREWVVAA